MNTQEVRRSPLRGALRRTDSTFVGGRAAQATLGTGKRVTTTDTPMMDTDQ